MFKHWYFMEGDGAETGGAGETTAVYTGSETATETGSGEPAGVSEEGNYDNSGSAIAETTNGDGERIKLVMDEKGRRKIIVEDSVEEENKTDSETDSASESGSKDSDGEEATATDAKTKNRDNQTQGLTEKSKLKTPGNYSDNELLLALQMGTVDEGRLSTVQAVQYGQYKERQAQQATLTNAKSQSKEATSNAEVLKQNVDSKRKYIREVDKLAKEQTLKELGITSEDLEVAEYSDDEELVKKVAEYKDMLAYNKSQILANVEVERAKADKTENDKKALIASINAFEQAERSKEPRFDEINKLMLTHFKKMELEVGIKYANAVNAYVNGAIDQAIVNDLQEYYNIVKKAVYANANGLSTIPKKINRNPPALEKAGTGREPSRKARPATALKDMGRRERTAWFEQYFG